jgi:hypothetical protein
MDEPSRRILLAVEPGVLEGALATLLAAGSDDDVVHVSRNGLQALGGGYDAAVVSDQVPEGVRAEVVITLPDTRGSGGTGTVKSGEAVYEVNIGGAERVVELLDQYAPRRS